MSNCANEVLQLVQDIESGLKPSPRFYAFRGCNGQHPAYFSFPQPNNVYPPLGQELPVYSSKITRAEMCSVQDDSSTSAKCPLPMIGSFLAPTGIRVRFNAATDETPDTNPQKKYYSTASSFAASQSLSNTPTGLTGYYTGTDIVDSPNNTGVISDFVSDIGQLDLYPQDAVSKDGVFDDLFQKNYVWASSSRKDPRQSDDKNKVTSDLCVNDFSKNTEQFDSNGKMQYSLISCGSPAYFSNGPFTMVVNNKGQQTTQFAGEDLDFGEITKGACGNKNLISNKSGTNNIDYNVHWTAGPYNTLKHMNTDVDNDGKESKTVQTIKSQNSWGENEDTFLRPVDGFTTTDCLFTKAQIEAQALKGPLSSFVTQVYTKGQGQLHTSSVRCCLTDGYESVQIGISSSQRNRYGCTNKLAGSLDSIQVDFVDPTEDDVTKARVIDYHTWVAYFCSGRAELKVGNQSIERFKPGSPACTSLMKDFCLSNGLAQTDPQFRHSCSCIREAGKLRSLFNGNQNVPIGCFIGNCSNSDPSIFKVEGSDQPCTAKVCQQVIDLNSSGLLVDGTQELKCGSKTFKVEPTVQFDPNVTVPKFDTVKQDIQGHQITDNDPHFSILLYISIAFMASMVLLGAMYFYVYHWSSWSSSPSSTEVDSS